MARAATKKVLVFLFITACLILGKLFFSAAGVFGHSAFVINGFSMEPEYPIYSLVIIRQAPFETLCEGDVIVFRASALNGKLAFHRVSSVTEEGVFTKGDNNAVGDNQLITRGDYVGKGIFKISFFARWLLFIQQPRGFVLYLLLPLFAAALMIFSCKQLRRTGK